ncbi:MAG TPA: type II toxin-antitoxin system death-on-curing family toxin [Pontiellaceae bacterium]|nr:type II toxin-antitoxin system death-on-curing family toxin [Pontiellaceae bacterium]
MKEPVWVPAEVILAIQEELLARFGGLSGLRDEGLLDSALNRPRQVFHYGSPALFDLAAEYALGIVKNHPFLDGNKRAGFMAAYTFLGVNGYDLNAPEAEAVMQTVALAAGEIDEKDYAAWLKASCQKRKRP